MLLMAASWEELLIAQDSLTFLLRNLEFLIKTQKLTLDPPSTLEFLGVLVNSQNKTLSQPQQKVEKIKTLFTELLEKSLAWARELNKLIGWLSFTVLLAPLKYRALQHQQIQGMTSKSFLEWQLSLSKQVKWKATLVDPKSQPVQWEILNFCPGSTNNKLRHINPGLGALLQRQTTVGL